METILKLNRWANAHTNIGFDALRLLLGGFLFYKGLFLFGSNSQETLRLMEIIPGLGGNIILLHYVELAQICAGILIAIGMLTRISSLVVLPILVGAVLVNCIGEVYMPGLIQASLCLSACIFFIFYGSGKHSVDYNLQMHM